MKKLGSLAIDACGIASSLFTTAFALAGFSYLAWGGVADTPALVIQVGDWLLVAGTVFGFIGITLCATWVVLSLLAWAVRRVRLVIA